MCLCVFDLDFVDPHVWARVTTSRDGRDRTHARNLAVSIFHFIGETFLTIP
jgi:hypothetical protein